MYSFSTISSSLYYSMKENELHFWNIGVDMLTSCGTMCECDTDMVCLRGMGNDVTYKEDNESESTHLMSTSYCTTVSGTMGV